MLTKIPAAFTREETARAALTETRKRCRVALRGAVVIGPDYHGAFYVHAPLGRTGFGAAELAAELRAGNY